MVTGWDNFLVQLLGVFTTSQVFRVDYDMLFCNHQKSSGYLIFQVGIAILRMQSYQLLLVIEVYFTSNKD